MLPELIYGSTTHSLPLAPLLLHFNLELAQELLIEFALSGKGLVECGFCLLILGRRLNVVRCKPHWSSANAGDRLQPVAGSHCFELQVVLGNLCEVIVHGAPTNEGSGYCCILIARNMAQRRKFSIRLKQGARAAVALCVVGVVQRVDSDFFAPSRRIDELALTNVDADVGVRPLGDGIEEH